MTSSLLLVILLGAAQSTGQMSPTSDVSSNRVRATGASAARPLRDHLRTLPDAEIIASGTTTGRTLHARFAEVVNVKDFGAKGDWNGVTGTDDAAAINAAISALPSNGGTVFFPEGVYYITTTAQTTKPGVRLVGTNRCGYFPNCGSKLITDQAIWMVQFGTGVGGGSSQHSGPVIEWLGFESTNGTALGGVRLYQQNHARVRQSAFYRFTAGTGLSIEGGTDASILPEIEGALFLGCKYGIKATNGLVTGMRVRGGYFAMANGSDYATPTGESVGIDYNGDTAHIQANFDGWPVAIRFDTLSDYAGHMVTGGRFEGDAIAVQVVNGGMVSVVGNAFIHQTGGVAVELNGTANSNAIYGNVYGGVTPLVDNTTQMSGFRADASGADPYAALVRRNTAGDVTHTLEHKWQGYGSDAAFNVSSGRGAVVGSIRTNFQSSPTVQIGSVNNVDVEFIHSSSPVITVASNGLVGPSGASMVHQARVADSGTSVAHVFGNYDTLTTGGQKIASFWSGGNATTEKAWISNTGQIAFKSGLWFEGTGLPTCYATLEGYVARTGGETGGTRTRLCLCTSDGGATPAYAWQNLTTGTVGSAGACDP